MFLKDYLNDVYYNQVIDNYEYEYLYNLNYDRFRKIYDILVKYNFDYIEDIILRYIELFELDTKKKQIFLDEGLSLYINFMNLAVMKEISRFIKKNQILKKIPYLELKKMALKNVDKEYVENSIKILIDKLGNNYVRIIGNDMRYFDIIIESKVF